MARPGPARAPSRAADAATRPLPAIRRRALSADGVSASSTTTAGGGRPADRAAAAESAAPPSPDKSRSAAAAAARTIGASSTGDGSDGRWQPCNAGASDDDGDAAPGQRGRSLWGDPAFIECSIDDLNLDLLDGYRWLIDANHTC